MDDDKIPNPNDLVSAYVVTTTKQGCFVRLSRSIEGRIILKELSDDFIPNPFAMFPPGRLIVGKVKHVKESQGTKKSNQTLVDLDTRESVLLASGKRLTMDQIEENAKYTGVITRVESYGVFVRIDNSDVSGLAHVSECSDSFIKNIYDLYNPGDFVKLVVISIDKEQGRLAFSLKASNFVGDDDSDDERSSSSSSLDGMEEESDDSDGGGGNDHSDDDSIDSEDEAFATKLAKKMDAEDDDTGVDDEESEGCDDDDSSSKSDYESSSDEDCESEERTADSEAFIAMNTDVGFEWGATSSKPSKSNLSTESSDDDKSSESSEDESDDADSGFKSSHTARKKAAVKKREEEETSRREAALADGTADETPETTVDFERLVASNPNSSEVWIKYMAFHLSLADIDSARNVAARAFKRIEFREEGEKVSCCISNHHCIMLSLLPIFLELSIDTLFIFSLMYGQRC